jgi:hypothetical protein
MLRRADEAFSAALTADPDNVRTLAQVCVRVHVRVCARAWACVCV